MPPLGSQFILLMLNSSVVLGDLGRRAHRGGAGRPGPHVPRRSRPSSRPRRSISCLSLLFSRRVRRRSSAAPSASRSAADEHAQPRRFRLPAARGALDDPALGASRSWAAASIGLVIALHARLGEPRRRAGSRSASSGVFQGTPLLLQLFLVFFGGDMHRPAARALALGGARLQPQRRAPSSARSGAARSRRCRTARSRRRGRSGLHYWPRMLRVVLPQALRTAIPPTVGLPRQPDQEHVAGRHHRLRRADAGRAAAQQRDLPARS